MPNFSFQQLINFLVRLNELRIQSLNCRPKRRVSSVGHLHVTLSLVSWRIRLYVNFIYSYHLVSVALITTYLKRLKSHCALNLEKT